MGRIGLVIADFIWTLSLHHCQGLAQQSSVHFSPALHLQKLFVTQANIKRKLSSLRKT